MKKVLVTGGAGFIGSHVCERLVAEGCSVVAADNLSLGRLANLARIPAGESFQFRQVELLDEAAIDQLFAEGDFHIVYHLAANSDISQSHETPRIDLENTLLTTFRTLEGMRRHGVREIVFASTSAIYGEVATRISETYGPLLPVSHYGAAKLGSEGFLTSFAANYGVRVWIVRFPNVVGGHATHGVVHDFIRKLRRDPTRLEVLGDGKQRKPYLYVQDLIDAIFFLQKNAREAINCYNVGVDSATTVDEIAQMVIRSMGLSSEIVYTGGDRGWIGDVPRFEYDLSKAAALGWIAPRTSNEAVQKAIDDLLGSD